MDFTVVVANWVEKMVIVRKRFCVTVSVAVSVSVSVIAHIEVDTLVVGTVRVVRTTEITVTVVAGRVEILETETVRVTGAPGAVVVTVDGGSVTVVGTVRTVVEMTVFPGPPGPGWLTTVVVTTVAVTVTVIREAVPLVGEEGREEGVPELEEPDPGHFPNGA